MPTVRASGPANARIAIVGEAPGSEEESQGKPFVGSSGYLLDQMLADAGIARSECFVTNVCRERPPSNEISAWLSDRKTPPAKDWTYHAGKWMAPVVAQGRAELEAELRSVQPNIIIALGNTPLWSLTGRTGIMNWRGSQLRTAAGVQCIPTIHPAAVLREWKFRQIVVHDLRRAARFRHTQWQEPKYEFQIRPSFTQVHDQLSQLVIRSQHREPLRIAFDLETRAGHIACAGIAWSRTEAICLPFQCVENQTGYWTEAEELEIIRLLSLLLTAPGIRVVGQNILYDCQYTWKWWGFVPRVAQDTMISQHALFSDLPKSLAFLASMYAEHYVYWKDEGKEFYQGAGDIAPSAQDVLWRYNCLDCVYTLEVGEVLERTVEQMGMIDVHRFQQSMLWPVLRAMQLGIKVDLAQRAKLVMEVQEAIEYRERFLADVLGHPLNPDSPKQMQALFFGDLKLPVQMTRAVKGKPGRATLNDDALQKLAQKEPLVRPLIAAIGDIRTLRKFLSNFLTRPLDADGRWRCSFNIGGSASGKSAPKTYRLSSSESAFGTGANLQNIPSEKSKSIGKAAARGGIGDPYQFPNIRSIFVPSPGCDIIELDLQRADLFVVCWEADDAELKKAMLAGVDMHLLNAYNLEDKAPPPLEELVEGHPAYLSHRKPIEHARQFAKVWVHGTDYYGQPRTMAAHTGRSVAECERAQRIWFAAHPGIPRWHMRVEAEVAGRRSVSNRFGYRWQIFDRIDSIIPEAIAWVPQSTVSIVINKIWLNVFTHLPWCNVLAQVHDSLLIECPQERTAETLPLIEHQSRVVVPYQDPLVIPVTIKHSHKSWGDC
jgi:uracil-DNA glycosylase